VLMLRETALHAGHIDPMARATANGAIIMPPVPAFYALPRSVEEVVDQTVSRTLELLNVVIRGIKRWDGSSVAPDE
jgi:flavin prenyltransferase